MRILANFTKKVNTGAYENETYTVTFEAETEFNHIDRVADFLFCQCRDAVERQINGTANPQVDAVSTNGKRNGKKKQNGAKETKHAETPQKETTKEEPAEKAPTPSQDVKNGKKNRKDTTKADAPKGNGTTPQEAPLPVTEPQVKMLYRLAKEMGNETDADAKQFLCDGAEALTGKTITSVKELSRKNASRLIEKLLDIQRKAA